MTQSGNLKSATESHPLRQRLAPQASMRSLLGLIAASALGMMVFRFAIAGIIWAKILMLLVLTVAACFVLYAVLFLVANLFSRTTAPVADAIDASQKGP